MNALKQNSREELLPNSPDELQVLNDLDTLLSPEQAISGPAHILIVDDNRAVRETFTDLLELHGYQVTAVPDGKQALCAIREDTPDLILLDLILPDDTDGHAVLRSLRSEPATVALPVIMVSGLGESEIIVEGLDLGANDYITKGTDYRIILARVRTQLKLKRLLDQRHQYIQGLRLLNAMKDKFMRIAAHDLKTPLGAVQTNIGILDTIGNQPWSDKHDRIVARIQRAIRSALSIARDFLDAEALRTGELRLDRQTIHFNQQAIEVTDDLVDYAQQRGVEIRLDLSDDVSTCYADPERVKQIIRNLVSNGIKFSRQQPGAYVIVRASVEGDMIRCEVTDNGKGIAEKDKLKVFKWFVRLDTQPIDGEKSSGLGLAIVRSLVEMHDGDVGFNSVPDEGSCFWFRLPVNDAQDK